MYGMTRLQRGAETWERKELGRLGECFVLVTFADMMRNRKRRN